MTRPTPSPTGDVCRACQRATVFQHTSLFMATAPTWIQTGRRKMPCGQGV